VAEVGVALSVEAAGLDRGRVDGEQAELLAPVAKVVEPDDVPAHALVQVGDEGADDGAAEVAGVELLGDFGRGELDDDLLAAELRRRGFAEAHFGVMSVGAQSLEDVGENKSRKRPGTEEEEQMDVARYGLVEERVVFREVCRQLSTMVGCGFFPSDAGEAQEPSDRHWPCCSVFVSRHT
jgi:hypothetical protein